MAATTLTVKDGGGNPVSIAGQQDAAGAYHYRDVMEGLTPAGAPQALTIDGTDSGVWTHVVNFPSSFGISGALPAFASTPAFTISGNLPAFASTPTFNLGVLNGAATAANQAAVQSAPGTSAGAAVTVQGDASGVPVPVSGSVSVSNFPATQPVSATALPLPTGAATATNQTAVQSAPGTSASAAVTVQGDASGVPMPVSGSVSVSNLPAAGAALSVQVSASPSVQTTAYAAGEALGGLVTLSMARTNGGSGTLTNLGIQSNSGQTPTLWVYAWSKQPASTCTDQQPFVMQASDRPYLLPNFPQPVTLSNPGSWETGTYGLLSDLNSQFVNHDTSPGKNVYVCLVTATALTPGSTTDLTVNANAIQD